MTPAIEAGYREVPGGIGPVWHYRLAPGTALVADEQHREYTEVKISRDMAKRASYTFILKWVRGLTVCEFTLDARTYYQPLPAVEVEAPAKAPKPERPRLTKVKAVPVEEAPTPEPPARKPRKRVGLL